MLWMVPRFEIMRQRLSGIIIIIIGAGCVGFGLQLWRATTGVGPWSVVCGRLWMRIGIGAVTFSGI